MQLVHNNLFMFSGVILGKILKISAVTPETFAAAKEVPETFRKLFFRSQVKIFSPGAAISINSELKLANVDKNPSLLIEVVAITFSSL